MEHEPLDPDLSRQFYFAGNKVYDECREAFIVVYCFPNETAKADSMFANLKLVNLISEYLLVGRSVYAIRSTLKIRYLSWLCSWKFSIREA